MQQRSKNAEIHSKLFIEMSAKENIVTHYNSNHIENCATDI